MTQPGNCRFSSSHCSRSCAAGTAVHGANKAATKERVPGAKEKRQAVKGVLAKKPRATGTQAEAAKPSKRTVMVMDEALPGKFAASCFLVSYTKCQHACVQQANTKQCCMTTQRKFFQSCESLTLPLLQLLKAVSWSVLATLTPSRKSASCPSTWRSFGSVLVATSSRFFPATSITQGSSSTIWCVPLQDLVCWPMEWHHCSRYGDEHGFNMQFRLSQLVHWCSLLTANAAVSPNSRTMLLIWDCPLQINNLDDPLRFAEGETPRVAFEHYCAITGNTGTYNKGEMYSLLNLLPCTSVFEALQIT